MAVTFAVRGAIPKQFLSSTFHNTKFVLSPDLRNLNVVFLFAY